MWSDNWFDATGKSANDVYRASTPARIPGTYTHVMAAFARPDFTWHGLTANSFAGTGLDFTATPAGANLVVTNGDAQCEGARNLRNQYGMTLNQPYSVERYLNAVTGNAVNPNARDGAMLWSILKTPNGSCGGAALASPGSIGQRLGQTFGLPVDPLLQSADWR